MNPSDDVRALIARFGHGDCHDLTWALHKKYGAKAVVIRGEQSNIPVHSCVLIDATTTLDAYGLNTLKATLARYASLACSRLGEPLVIDESGHDVLHTLGGQLGESPDDILAEFQPVLDFYGLDAGALLTVS